MSHDSPSGNGLSRRSALKVGAVGCTGAIVATSVGSTQFSKQKVPFQKWQSAIGHDIRIEKKSFVQDDSFRPLTLRLVEAVQVESKTQPGNALPTGVPEHAIALRFEGCMRTQLKSATYNVGYPGIGECKLFLNEVQSEPGATVRTFASILS